MINRLCNEWYSSSMNGQKSKVNAIPKQEVLAITKRVAKEIRGTFKLTDQTNNVMAKKEKDEQKLTLN